MKKQDRLFVLVKSLTKSEKRFFKIFSSRHVIGSENKYVQLFDVIDKSKKYDETAILKKFKGEKFINRLAVAKSYLYELILKSMNSYHAQNNIDNQIRELLSSITFLHKKGLFAQAEKLLTKARKLAVGYERSACLLEIFRLQKKNLENQWLKNRPFKEIEKLRKEETKLLQKLGTINQWWSWQAKVNFINHNQGKKVKSQELDSIKKILEEGYSDIDQPLPYEAELYQNKSFATYYFLKREFESCYKYSKKTIDLLESRPSIIAEEGLLYVKSINNLLNMESLLGKTEEGAEYLSKLKAMLADSNVAKQDQVYELLFQAYYYHQMHLYIARSAYKEAIPLVIELKNGLELPRLKFGGMGETMLCFYAFNISLNGKLLDQAKWFLEKILIQNQASVRPDIYTYSRILSLLLAYDIGEDSYIKETVKKTYIYLNNKKPIYKLEVEVKIFLKQLASNPIENTLDIKRRFARLISGFKSLKEDPYEQRAFAYFDFLEWLLSKQNEDMKKWEVFFKG